MAVTGDCTEEGEEIVGAVCGGEGCVVCFGGCVMGGGEEGIE